MAGFNRYIPHKIGRDRKKSVEGSSAMFFGAISVLNSIFVILYLTGRPKPEDDFRNKHEGAFFS